MHQRRAIGVIHAKFGECAAAVLLRPFRKRLQGSRGSGHLQPPAADKRQRQRRLPQQTVQVKGAAGLGPGAGLAFAAEGCTPTTAPTMLRFT